MMRMHRYRLIVSILFLSLGITLHAQVVADFIFDKSEGCGSLPVNFTDQSTTTSGSIIDWRWNLGSITSSKQNPGILFTTPGEYTICLTIKTSTGATSTICKEKLIKVYADPVANFNVDIKNTCAPALVNFQDMSTTNNGTINSWVWDIGGTANVLITSDPTTPVSTLYLSEGIYTATLSIIDVKGCKNTITKSNILEVQELPDLNVDFKVLSGCSLPWKVEFQNLDPDPKTTYHWNFGNGETFDGPNPNIVSYSQSKNYDVSITMTKGECIDTIIYTDMINTQRIVGFELLSTSLCEGQNIVLKDTSNYLADSLTWDFGDGQFSHEVSPAHIYTSPGCYTIKLTKYIGSCILSATHPCINILPKPIINYDIVNGNSCVIPANIKLQSSANETGIFNWKLYGTGLNESFIGTNHNYSLPDFGNYFIDLIFTSDKGCILNFDSVQFAINKFEASLPYLGPANCVPYEATITDSIVSNTPVVNWQWSIGNPPIFTSNIASPRFMVTDTGRWDVKLIVTNAFGCRDTIVKYDYVRGGIKPVVDFTADPLKGCISEARQFLDLSSSFADRWIWEQNDTFISFEHNPLYQFNNFGMFDITLKAFHNGCGSSLKKLKYIDVFKPKSQFKVTYRCDDPFTIDILNQTLGADSLYWLVTIDSTRQDTIRDSLLSTYTFPGRGMYFLSHYAKNFESGCEHIQRDTIFIVDLKGEYTLDTIKGCAPLNIDLFTNLQDAVSTEFLSGQYNINYPEGESPVLTINEGGLIMGPQMLITDRHGCKDTFQLSIPIEVSKPSAQILASDVVCIPDKLPLIDNSIPGLSPIVERRWSFSTNNQNSIDSISSFDVIAEGSFIASLFIQDNWGCTDSITKTIQGIKLDPEFSSDTLSCTSQGIRFKVDSDATYLSSYFWDFGDGNTSTEKNPLHYYVEEGIYSVCVEMFDSRGCSKQICKDSFITIANPVAIFTGSPLEAPCPPLLTNFGNQSRFATSYIWDFGDNSGFSYNRQPSHVYTKPGRFTVSLFATMVPGCTDTLMMQEFVKLNGPSAELNFSLEGNCTPIKVNLNATADKDYNFIWDYGDGNIFTVPSLIQSDSTEYIYKTPGSYVPKLLVTDSAGCARTFTIDPIIVNEVESLFSIENKKFCSASAEINLLNNTTSSSTDLTYDWNINGIKSYKSNEVNPKFSIEGYGKFDVSLTVSTQNCTDTFSIDSIIELSSVPVPGFELQSNNLCANVGIDINNTSSNNYGDIIHWEWTIRDSVISTAKNPNVIFATSGLNIVKLKAITDKGCVDSISQSLIIKPNTLVTLVDEYTICIGDSVDIIANIQNGAIPFTYSWYDEPTLKCKACLRTNVKPLQSTKYYFETVSGNGCINVDSSNVNVIQIAGPTLELSADTTVCIGNQMAINILNYDPDYQYAWDTKDPGLDCYQNCQTVNAQPIDDTYYSLLVTNMHGCFKQDSILVRVEKNIPDFLVENKAVCEGQSVTVALSGGVNPMWVANPDLSCISCPNPAISPNKSGYYVVNVQSVYGCHYLDSVFVELVPLASVNAGLDKLICRGEEVQLNGTGKGDIMWSNDQGQSISQGKLSIIVTPYITTIYHLTAKYDECVINDTVQISVISKTDVTAVGDTICPDEIGILTASGNSETYHWYYKSQKIGLGDELQMTNDESIDLYVIGSKGKCITDTAHVRLHVHPKIDYKLEKDNYEIFINTKAKIEADYNPNNTYIFEWSPGTGLSCDDCPDPEIQHIENSNSYNLLVTDEFGCQIEKTIYAKFSDECSKKGFYIPNIFTPYSSVGTNDLFKVYAEEEGEFISVSIFDRWGELIYTSTDISDTWDGMYKGRQLAQGVYAYIVTARCNKTNEIFKFGGDVTIVE